MNLPYAFSVLSAAAPEAQPSQRQPYVVPASAGKTPASLRSRSYSVPPSLAALGRLKPGLRAVVLLALSLALPSARAADANPPNKMSYQGYAVDANGEPLGKDNPLNYGVIFRIYDVPREGTARWTEQQTVTIDKGYFSVLLGDGSEVGSGDARPDLSAVFAGANASDRFIGITVKKQGAPDMEILPRLRLLPAPYSFLAAKANAVVNASGVSLINTLGGNVGIGTTSPQGRLDIRDGAGTVFFAVGNDYPRVYLGGARDDIAGVFNRVKPAASLFFGEDNDPGGYLLRGTGDINIGSGRFFVQSGGRVGIGTTSPNAGFAMQLKGVGNYWKGGIASGGNSAAVVLGEVGDVATIGGNNAAFTEWRNLAVNPYGGNVGIGTAAPNHKFQVVGPDNVAAFTSTGGNAYIRLWDTTGFDNRIEFASRGNGRAAIWSGGDHLNVLRNGNVGIGTTIPGAPLDVRGYVKFGTPGQTIQFEAQSGFTRAAFDELRFWDWTTGGDMVTFSNGKVGIGTTSPEVPLHVVGFGSKALINSPDGFDNDSGFNGRWGLGTVAGGTFNVSILASGWVAGEGIVANSDRRIKEIVGPSDSVSDLELIQRLRVTDYRPKDKLADGGSLRKGLIAQEVLAIIPAAVARRKGVVPDIYRKATEFEFDPNRKTLSINLPTEHHLAARDVVQLYLDNSVRDLTVVEVPSGDRFVVESVEMSPQQVFVFGRHVDDFLSVNYDHIFTMGISAIQELARQVDALKQSEARIAELEQTAAKVVALEQKAAQVDSLEREVAELKKLVAGLAQGRTGPRPSSRNLAAAASH